ncbi:formylmethionine deformylase [Clostridium carboxidivorans P7]|uniref:Peptide deformylase n=1 Tax=Clostridium carboxidivorans P7 TaxID=536227 RepID=C6PPN8_9CLOT|nr:peptide deformylase [Clostridium carboxidivorans]AKN30349.1 formylmethionine deformylase [Clostridium carboxidivorans P7]EET88768.1 formylmethionine deformylase [Clostridium carboxidivorans P7]
MLKEILLLGNDALYKKSLLVQKEELDSIKGTVLDLHDTLIDFRKKYNAGRAIAAPQIGVFKRLIYMYIDKPIVFINPILKFDNKEIMEVMDDCMSFPNLLVKVNRYKECTVMYKDIDFIDRTIKFEGNLSELIQHEYDHLDGILATMRAIDNKSFYLKKQSKGSY